MGEFGFHKVRVVVALGMVLGKDCISLVVSVSGNEVSGALRNKPVTAT